jgi:hypothetical protein
LLYKHGDSKGLIGSIKRSKSRDSLKFNPNSNREEK